MLLLEEMKERLALMMDIENFLDVVDHSFQDLLDKYDDEILDNYDVFLALTEEDEDEDDESNDNSSGWESL